MARHILLVLSNCAPGRDTEFNTWYDGTHLAEVAAVPGFATAERFALSDVQIMEGSPYRYLAIYDMETDDLKKTLDALTGSADDMTLSDSLDAENTRAWAFTPL